MPFEAPERSEARRLSLINPGHLCALIRPWKRPWQTEHFDVLIVGAGLSGIGAGYHLQQKCPGKSYVILEGRDCIGGTWDLFRYPGIRSDSDMFTLGYSFKPWTEPKAIADGPRILNYVRETAAENGIDKKIRFHHRVKRASWSTPEARWTVEAERSTGEGATETGALHLQFPVHVLGLLQIRGRLHAGICRARRISPAASCIRRNGPTTSTTPASAWW